MKVLNSAIMLLVALALAATLPPSAMAEQGGAESITVTIDRNVMPAALFHPKVRSFQAVTLTLHDFVIRDYLGTPIETFTIQTASGRTRVPLSIVKEVSPKGWRSKNTGDIGRTSYVVNADMLLTDGRQLDVVMNADFGTIEGKTKHGNFFLSDPHTVKKLVFNRYVIPEVEMEGEEPIPTPLDSDGDGVFDFEDRCPDTPMGVEVDEFGCPLDEDYDGISKEVDKCPGTPEGVEVDEFGCPLDTDGDGVPDFLDRCPDTPKGAPVNSYGCWTIRGVNFEYDKWDIKPQYFPVLNENCSVLEKNPSLTIEVQGHTDSIASDAYNQGLSEKRANATKDYIVTKGISPDRVVTRGFGERHPVATNETPEGRAKNRRIEIKAVSK